MNYTSIASVVCLFLAGCNLITIHSENEPKSDADALRIVGITMTSPPDVLYRKYEAGMDDNMRLVLRFPADRLDDFWAGSAWKPTDIHRWSRSDSSTVLPLIPRDGDVIWTKWLKSSEGWRAEGTLPKSEGVLVCVTDDPDPAFKIAYVFWGQT